MCSTLQRYYDKANKVAEEVKAYLLYILFYLTKSSILKTYGMIILEYSWQASALPN